MGGVMGSGSSNHFDYLFIFCLIWVTLYEVFSHTFKIREGKKIKIKSRTLRLFKVPTKKIILEGPKLVS
jgi:hypothetical protein